MKKTLALLLTALLVLCAGCSSAPALGEETPQPQVVYRPTYFDAPEEAEGLYNMLIANGRVYWTTTLPVEGDAQDKEMQYQMHLCSFAVDGTDYRSVPLTDPAAQDGEEANLNFYTLYAMPDGGFAGLSSEYDQEAEQTVYSLGFLNEQGEVTGRVSLKDKMPESSSSSGDGYVFSSYIDNMAVDGDGNLYLMISGSRGNNAVLILSQDGKKLGEVPLEDRYVNGIARMSDGRIALLGDTYTSSSSGYKLFTVDAAAKTVTDLPVEVPNGNGNLQLVNGDEQSPLYLISGDGFYALDEAGANFEKLFSFLAMDYNPDNVQGVFPIGQGQFLMFGWDFYSDRTFELARLEKREYAETRKIITVSTLYASNDLMRAVVNFNRKNEEYRVELTQYSDLDGDYDARMDRFRSDMTTGNMPDIVDASYLSFDNLAARGLFLDLSGFLDGDEGLNREDFVPSALRAMQTGDKLYFLSPDMYLLTMTGSKKIFPQETGMTMDEFVQLAAQHPEMAAFAAATQSDVLTGLTMVGFSDYIDPQTGACSFDSESFVNILNLAAKAPTEIDWENATRDALQVKNGEALVFSDSIYGLDSFLETVTELGDDYAIAGLPCKDRSLAAAQFNHQYAISAKAKYPEGAWAFLSYLMTGGDKNSATISHGGGGIPVLADAFEKHIEQSSTTTYHTDENGEQVMDSLYGIGFSDGTMLEIYPATPEQADQFRHLVDSISTRVTSDETVWEIISEEAAPFFEGQKSAQDAAAVIQNRVQTYISENR